VVNKSIFFLVVVALVGFIAPAIAREAAPIPYRSAPLIPWAKKVDEHRFRSPRNYDRTLEYYRKTILGAAHIVAEKIINTSAVRATHIRNKKAGARWEGMNIYEYKGSTFIFVVFSDKELKKIEEEKAKKAEKASSAKKPKKKGKMAKKKKK
jgi:hypothetical protein